MAICKCGECLRSTKGHARLCPACGRYEERQKTGNAPSIQPSEETEAETALHFEEARQWSRDITIQQEKKHGGKHTLKVAPVLRSHIYNGNITIESAPQGQSHSKKRGNLPRI